MEQSLYLLWATRSIVLEYTHAAVYTISNMRDFFVHLIPFLIRYNERNRLIGIFHW